MLSPEVNSFPVRIDDFLEEDSLEGDISGLRMVRNLSSSRIEPGAETRERQ